ncbi:MAG: GNAT family N-acetyltransferase [Phycisphaerales bacterium]
MTEPRARRPTIIHTARLLLRPLAEADREAYCRAITLSHDHLAPWSPAATKQDTPDSQFSAQLARTIDGIARDADYRFAAWHDDGRLAGMFNLNNVIRGVFQNAFAGWWLSADSLGRGFAFEALNALLTHAFLPAPQGLGLHRVQANIIPANHRSVRLAERLGFRHEGLARAYLKIAGEWQDHLMFAKLAAEHRAFPSL